MNKIQLIFIFLLCLSCEQNELPIQQHPMGVIETTQINLGSNYSQQIFYNLKDDIIVGNNVKTDWDLAFSSSINNQIIINSSTFSQISELENHTFEDPITIADLVWRWDDPKGIYNGTALDGTQSSSTYILDRGYNLDGTARGYRKFKIDSINNNSYFLSYAEIGNTDLNNIEIKKDGLSNFKYFSFNNNGIVDIEPDKNTWDLVFTQYTHLYNDNIETPAYLVTGVLTNYLNNVMVAKDSLNSFEEINLDMINSYNFSNHQDAIGFNWKVYNFQSQNYTVDTDLNYIIKDVSNRYFKLHFIDFYNASGEKGSPKFELQEL